MVFTHHHTAVCVAAHTPLHTFPTGRLPHTARYGITYPPPPLCGVCHGSRCGAICHAPIRHPHRTVYFTGLPCAYPHLRHRHFLNAHHVVNTPRTAHFVADVAHDAWLLRRVCLPLGGIYHDVSTPFPIRRGFPATRLVRAPATTLHTPTPCCAYGFVT